MRHTVIAAVIASLLLVATGGRADLPTSASYVGAGALVVRDADPSIGSILDDGGVVCDTQRGLGLGGGCIPFPQQGQGDSILVQDDIAGAYSGSNQNVAFQVCIDNNGDGLCTSSKNPDYAPPACADFIWFSHDDKGNFYNPLGPLARSFTPGCPGGFHGWIVFLCEGVHVAGTPHVHPAGRGSINLTAAGTGYGNFCGVTKDQIRDEISKPYIELPL